MKKKILLIGGPTAVGKTKLGITCANVFDGEIISADCMQIYTHLNIGTAKPTNEELSLAKHHLIDIKQPTEDFSAGEFKLIASSLIEEITKKQKLPILVGGTGLYLKSLLYPYDFSNTTKNEQIRQKYKNLASTFGNEYVFDILKKVDRVSASKLHQNDIKRVIRALEIFDTTGKPMSQQQNKVESIYDFKLIFLNDDREVLYNRINSRVDKMFEDGLEQEVLNVIKKFNLTKNNHSMQGIGYKEFFDYIDGTITKQQLIEKIKQNSRNYAKRQITWFKHMQNVSEYNINDIDKILLDIKNWLNN